jgi:DNA-binding transcriptional ArsR family regulator
MRATILTTNVAAAAALIGEPARAAILEALIREGFLPAGELARRAVISAGTASAYLVRLVAGGLIVVEPHGRRRFYQLAAPEVAAAVEALSYIAAPVPVRSLRQSDRAQALHEGRICYDHLAARLGVAFMTPFRARQALRALSGRDYDLTPSGTQLLAEVAVDVEQQRRRRRAFARGCLDWSQRRAWVRGLEPTAAASGGGTGCGAAPGVPRPAMAAARCSSADSGRRGGL